MWLVVYLRLLARDDPILLSGHREKRSPRNDFKPSAEGSVQSGVLKGLTLSIALFRGCGSNCQKPEKYRKESVLGVFRRGFEPQSFPREGFEISTISLVSTLLFRVISTVFEAVSHD